MRSSPRVLIVGLGSIGKRHVQVIHDLFPEMKIAVLRHKNCIDEGTGSPAIDLCFTSIDDAIAYQPDMAVIANPANKHIEVAMPLANAGIHLLVEKPISSDLTAVEDLIEICKKNGVKLMVAYNLRFLTSLCKFKDFLESGRIGRLLSVRAEVGQYLPSWRPGTDYRQTVSAQSKLGGGVLPELSHEIDYLLWLFGPAIWVSAYLSRQSVLDIDVEDTAHLQIGFDENYYGLQLVGRLDMDFVRHDTTRYCIVIGEKGTLRWDGVKGIVDYFPENGRQWEKLYSGKPDRNFTYGEEIRHFMKCIKEGSEPRISGVDGLAVLQVIDAAVRSNDSGQVVSVEKGRT